MRMIEGAAACSATPDAQLRRLASIGVGSPNRSAGAPDRDVDQGPAAAARLNRCGRAPRAHAVLQVSSECLLSFSGRRA
ncbi:hypothetical protein WS91_28035 [Burkholderia sp. MSMB1498]|nr:hypothetical protein WS91_28035 [Burkholderia sp. MSMB1498]